MAIPQLKAIIGADGKPLLKTLGELKSDITSFKRQLETASDPKFISKLNKGLKEAQANVKTLENYSEKATSSISNFGAGLLQGLGIAVFQQATSAVSDFFNGAIDEALDAARATESLRQSLEAVGRGDLFDGLIEDADELSKKFAYLDNDDFTAVFAKLAQFGDLTRKEIQDLIPVIVDLNAKQRLSGEVGKTVADTSGDIIKALAGQGRELKKYGVDVNASMTDTERLSAIMQGLGDKVKGTGKAFAESLEGKIEASRIKMAALQEEIGNKLLPVKAQLLVMLGDLVSSFVLLNDKLSMSAKAFRELRDAQNIAAVGQKEANRLFENFKGLPTDELTSELIKYNSELQKNETRIKQLTDKQERLKSVTNRRGRPAELDDTDKDALERARVLQSVNSQTVGLLQKELAVRQDISKIGTRDTGDTEKDKRDFLADQLSIAKALAAVHPEEGSLLSDVVRIEGSIKFRELKEAGASPEQLQIAQDGINKQIAEIEKKYGDRPALVTVPFSIRTDLQKDVAGNALGGEKLAGRNMYQSILDKAATDGQSAREELAANTFQVSGFMQDALTDVGASLGESLGDAFSGKGFKPFDGVITAISDALKNLGKALIAFGVAKKLAMEGLKSLNPFLAIGAGIAAIAAAAVLKNSIDKSGNGPVRKFAQGGVANKATYGIFGEAGPEAIIPLDRLPSLINRTQINGGGGGGVLEVRMKGTELVGLYDLTKKSNNRRQ